MTAPTPDSERPSAQQDLEGIDPTSGSLLDLGDAHLPYVRGGKAELARRKASRYYTEQFNLTGEPEPMTVAEQSAYEQGLTTIKNERLRREAHLAGEPEEHSDDVRRSKLRWAADLVRDAGIADGVAYKLENNTGQPKGNRIYTSAEEARDSAYDFRVDAGALVLSACNVCIFQDRCELSGDSERVVTALGSTTLRQRFVEAMSGVYGSGYVSCESVIDPRKN